MQGGEHEHCEEESGECPCKTQHSFWLRSRAQWHSCHLRARPRDLNIAIMYSPEIRERIHHSSPSQYAPVNLRSLPSRALPDTQASHTCTSQSLARATNHCYCAILASIHRSNEAVQVSGSTLARARSQLLAPKIWLGVHGFACVYPRQGEVPHQPPRTTPIWI